MRVATILQLALGFGALFGYAHLKVGSSMDAATRGPSVRAAKAEAQLSAEKVAGELSASLNAVRSVVSNAAASAAAQAETRGQDITAKRQGLLNSVNAQLGSGAASALVTRTGTQVVEGDAAKAYVTEMALAEVRQKQTLVRFEKAEDKMVLMAMAAAPDGTVLAASLPVTPNLLRRWLAESPAQVGLSYDENVLVHTLGKRAAWPSGAGEVLVGEEPFVAVERTASNATIVAMSKINSGAGVSVGERAGMWVLMLGVVAFLLASLLVMLAPAGAAKVAEEATTSIDLNAPTGQPVSAVITPPKAAIDFSSSAKEPTPAFLDHPAPQAAASDFEASFLKSTRPALTAPDGLPPPHQEAPAPTRPLPVTKSETQPLPQTPPTPISFAPAPTQPLPTPSFKPAPAPIVPPPAAAPPPVAAPPPAAAPPPVFSNSGNSDFDAIANAAVSRPPPVSQGTDLPAPRGEVPPELRAAHRAEEQRKAHDRLMTGHTPTSNFTGGSIDADTDLPAPRDSNLPAPKAGSIPPRTVPLPGEQTRPAAVALPGSPAAPVPAASGAVALPGSAPAPQGAVPLPGGAAPAAMPPGGPMPFDEAHYRVVYNEFVASKARLGEVVENISYDGFRSKLRTSEQHLLSQHGCRAVRFQVLVKDKTVSLRPQLVR